jgi:hypothetical protein
MRPDADDYFPIAFLMDVPPVRTGVPEILDGQYVAEARGRILSVISEKQYLSMKGAELRMFAILNMTISFVPMTYWWFHRNEE